MTGRAIWICGVPASGKTTLAHGLIQALRARGEATLWLDSDDLRGVLTPDPDYSDAERDRFYSAITHLARLGVDGGATVVISATAAHRRHRDALRATLARFTEVELQCEARALRDRDVKGLYRAADGGQIARLPGVGVPFESSARAELVLDTTELDAPSVLARALAVIER